MASNLSQVPSPKIFNIIQYNLHGLQQGTPLLNYLCQDVSPSVFFISEHWQTPANLHKILNFSDMYTGFGISSMTSVVQKSILRGRPWGGCATLIKNNLLVAAKPILTTDSIVILSLGQFILVNVYLPCLSLSSVDIFGGILDEIAGALEGLSHEHLIFGGDLNCNVHDNSVVANMIRNFMATHNLDFCDHLIDINQSYISTQYYGP